MTQSQSSTSTTVQSSSPTSPSSPPLMTSVVDQSYHKSAVAAAATALTNDKSKSARPSITPVSSTTPDSPRSKSAHTLPLHARPGRRSLAAFARERTSSAIANLASITSSSNQALRTVTSSASLSRPNRGADNTNKEPDETFSPSTTTDTRVTIQPTRTGDSLTPTSSPPRSSGHLTKPSLSRPPSPVPVPLINALGAKEKDKMHQTSSRLLRMTDEERPFTRDFKDLFSTLMVSLPLTAHRVRFSKVEQTFSSEEAINNLGSLKFSQSNRMPDPKDPSRIVTTTTTTTFSMAKEMARSVCQRFMEARFIEPADGKPLPTFPAKGVIWQITPKGIHVLHRFCQRNGINAAHVTPVLARDNMHLVILERDSHSDKLDYDRGTIEVIFRRFIGQDGPNVKQNATLSDSDSVTDYMSGLVGVKMAKERKIFDRVVTNSFTGKATTDWLMDCCTTIDRRETYALAEMFIKHGLMWAVVEDKVYMHQNPGATIYQPTKNAIYALTDRGQRLCGWITREKNSEAVPETREVRNDTRTAATSNLPRDSNNNRLNNILQDPALRLLFREFLRLSLCEENLSFYLEIRDFTENYHQQDKQKAFTRTDAVRDTLAAAYGIYNAFLAPGSPCELNIDHSLRNSLASRMTRAVGDEDSMLKGLREVVELFEMAQNSVFKLMSSDSVPKFVKDPRYVNVLREHNIDLGIPNGRSFSPAPAVTERPIGRSGRQ